ncbi:putative tyrosine carboxypeptidase MATCAP2 [Paramormyrops kingsleyae]|uniref:putative tyrosine carboxypeptidase MATCAP2 n=1 Tax=Paramormyrops kingsleyae TaxID=1676925 RepID=UPI003B96F7F8
MLESIKVTERLRWPELEMSKKYLLSPSEKPGSPNHMCLEKMSSGVLKNLFTTGTSSYNVFLQAEEEERRSPKHSPLRRAGGVHHSSVTHPLCAGGEDYGKQARIFITASLTAVPLPAPAITVMGSTVNLSPRPYICSRRIFPSDSPHTKLPLLAKGSDVRGGENALKKICILTAVKPSNLDKEKAKFFKSNFTYNPQFEYNNPVSPVILARYSNASDRFLTQAVRIMELTLDKYGNYEKFQQATGGSLLSKGRIWNHVKKYMEKEGCMGEIVVHLSEDLLSRASMTVVNSRPTLTINMSTAREHWLEGMLRHEIGTHYYRGLNNSRQPWSSGAARRRHSLRPLNPTEEGLASIHSVLFRRDPTLWRAALLYYTVYQASRLPFAQLFHSLGRFVQDPGTRWDYCVRAKRGQTDTSQPGCFSKDQVYLDGILKILRYREKIDFPLLMALGKVSFEDVDRLKGLAVMDHVRIPHFLQDQARYLGQLEKIMEVNRLTDVELRALI